MTDPALLFAVYRAVLIQLYPLHSYRYQSLRSRHSCPEEGALQGVKNQSQEPPLFMSSQCHSTGGSRPVIFQSLFADLSQI